jgi:hypothetical protein
VSDHVCCGCHDEEMYRAGQESGNPADCWVGEREEFVLPSPSGFGAHFLLPRPVASYLRELAAHSERTEWKGQWFGGACPDCHHATVHDSLGCTDKGPPFGSPCRCARKGPGKIPLDKTLPK